MKWGATVSPASQHVSAATADGMIHRHDYRSLVTLLDRRMQSDTTSAASGVRVATLRELRASHQVLGHFRDAAAATNRLVDAILAFDSPADALRERMMSLADRAVWEADVAALRRAKDSLSSARLPSSTPTLDQPFNAEFDVWLAVGHVDSATSVLARWNQALTGSESTIDRNARLVARAELALARGDARRAVPMFRSAQQSKCGLCLSPKIARAYEALQQPDSALLEYEKYVGESTPFRAASDARELARTYKRLGELYEAKGDTKRAIQWYTDFVALWKDADTELQPKVTEIRERIMQLQKKIG
jgi:tetratricopeptide (TPR) repeat protein